MRATLLGAVLGAVLATGAAARGLIEVRECDTLRVGVAEGPPYRLPDPMTGRYVRRDIDLAEKVAEVTGVELEVVPATWATLVTGLGVDQHDVIFANLSATPERAVSVAFTDACVTYGFHVMVAADGELRSLEDLIASDMSLVGVAGTVEAQHSEEFLPGAQVDERVTDQADAGATSVRLGQSDAVLVDPGRHRIPTAQDPVMAERMRLLNGQDELAKPVSLSRAVERGDRDMLNFLDVFIRGRVANDAIAPARDEWFDEMAEQQGGWRAL